MDKTHGKYLGRPGFWAVFPAALLLFLLAKNIASASTITVDRFEYWIVGLAPVLAYYGLGRLENSGRTGLKDVFSIGIAAWLLALVAYLVLQLTFLSEVLQFPIQEKFGYASPLSFAISSAVYVAFGSIGAFLLFLHRYRRDPATRFATAILALALNWVMFFTLVFAI
ncbi:MAG: hypothetical protein ABL936_02765 [Aestuariivirga sp.]